MLKLLQHTRRPDITFYRNGRINITAEVARALSLSPGDHINIAVSGREYLLFASRPTLGRHEAQVHRTKRGSDNYATSSARLCRSLFDAIGFTGDRLACMVGESIEQEQTVYIPIITKQPL